MVPVQFTRLIKNVETGTVTVSLITPDKDREGRRLYSFRQIYLLTLKIWKTLSNEMYQENRSVLKRQLCDSSK